MLQATGYPAEIDDSYLSWILRGFFWLLRSCGSLCHPDPLVMDRVNGHFLFKRALKVEMTNTEILWPAATNENSDK